ncbi:MAG TPA: hypothetical protein VGA53_05075 [Candidatus Paceibacterota bacterium]
MQVLLLNNTRKQKGGSLVEIIIVAGIIMSSLGAILGLAAFFLATSQVVQQTSQAAALAQEALEIVRNYRDGTSWAVGLDAVTPGGPYHPVQSGGPPPAWTLVSGSEAISEFTREIQFEEVCRDGNDDIAPCGFPADPDTVKAVVTVSWTERGRNHEVELVEYFTDWKQ